VRSSIDVAALVDTSVLVYRVDPRFPEKQERARRVLRRGAEAGELKVPHQALVEFVAVVTRPMGGRALLPFVEAVRIVEETMRSFEVLHPTDDVLRAALRGVSAYGLPWFDAHLWAYAESYGIEELLSEDFEHGRVYGTVRIVDPFR
jgi:predicted nucleic acid-binding protein